MIHRVPASSRIVARLLHGLAATYVQMYGNADLSDAGPADFAPPDGACLVAFDGDEAVGMVALRRYDAETAHVMRLYVVERARGHGWASRLADAALTEARQLGYSRAVWDTGAQQRPVIAITERIGARIVAPFGKFARAPDLRCYALCLPWG